MSPIGPRSVPGRAARQRLAWLTRHTHVRGLEGCVETMTLDQLEDSRRPLLFSLLPRMLQRDGSTAKSLQHGFAYVDQDRDRAPALMVSSRRWSRAVATSRKLAARRVARGAK